MARRKMLAFAVATGRVGSVFFMGGRLMDWQMSNKASRDNIGAAEHAQNLINKYRPDVVVTQDPRSAGNKGERSLLIIDAIARTAATNNLLHIAVPRQRSFGNKYAEADMLAERYPDVAAWKPQKRRAFDNEPRNTVIFEALALAEAIIDRSAQEGDID
jgi:hypothetical protein